MCYGLQFVPVVFQKAINGVKIDESTEKGHVRFKLKIASERELMSQITVFFCFCFETLTLCFPSVN